MRSRKSLFAAAIVVTAAATVFAGQAAFADPPADEPDAGIQIIGGRAATEVYPFFASLQTSSGQHTCGGSLIKSDWVVTAAHCVNSTPYQVRIGATNYSSGGEVVRVASKQVHSGGMQGHDIALLKLSQASTKTPIPLAASSGSPGDPTRLMGHGQSTCTSQGGCSQTLQLMEIDVTVRADSDCVGIAGATEICLGQNGSGACYGDSGGPAVRKINSRWELTGATSRGGSGSPRCAEGPAVYTDVVAHKSWVEQYTGPLTEPDPGPDPGTGLFTNDNDVQIPDRATVESPISVTGRTGNAPSTLKATVAIKHTYRGDLQIDVIAPDGTAYRVKNAGWDSADDVNATYTINASSEPANGTWKLRVADLYSGDSGYIDRWSLQF